MGRGRPSVRGLTFEIHQKAHRRTPSGSKSNTHCSGEGQSSCIWQYARHRRVSPTGTHARPLLQLSSDPHVSPRLRSPGMRHRQDQRSRCRQGAQVRDAGHERSSGPEQGSGGGRQTPWVSAADTGPQTSPPRGHTPGPPSPNEHRSRHWRPTLVDTHTWSFGQ